MAAFHGTGTQYRKIAKQYDFCNDTQATKDRLTLRVNDLPSQVHIAILSACRQTYREGSDVLYNRNTFAIMLRPSQHEAPFGLVNISASRIQRLRIEIQLDDIGVYFKPSRLRPKEATWSTFRHMTGLKVLQLVVTFWDERSASKSSTYFNKCWHSIPLYYHTVQGFIAAVPKGVEFRCGLTKEDKLWGDYGAFEPVKGSVLRKAYKTFSGLQGADSEIKNEASLYPSEMDLLEIDGDGYDSDQEDNTVGLA